ncbi:MAG: hypothetical protein ACXW2Q_00635 [Thermoanaerobaculia bacterium]
MNSFARNHRIPIEWAKKGVRKEDYVRSSMAITFSVLARRMRCSACTSRKLNLIVTTSTDDNKALLERIARMLTKSIKSRRRTE